MSITRSSPVQVAAYSTTYSQAPKLVSTSWSKVSIGPSHVLAIKSNNTLWSWGINTYGQLGDGTTITRSSPVQLGNPGYAWNDISAGLNYSVALRGDNLLFTWGLNTAGVLGDLNIIVNGSRSSPIQIGASSWTQISAGSTHVVAIRSDKKLFTWGLNSVGQLGNGDYANRSSPVQVGTSSWSVISAGQTHTTAITTDGKLYTWGDNTVGTLGYTTPLTTYYSWTSVAGNSDYSIAIRNDGLLFAWGTNTLGQLGLNDTIPRSSPTQIGTNSWNVVTANAPTGGGPVLAVRNDGTLWSWGYNVTGVLGLGDTAYRSSPTQVGTLSSWTTVSASKSHALALDSSGNMYGWGQGNTGQLASISSWSKVAEGYALTVAIKNDGTLWTWGTNSFGQLGENTITAINGNRSVPVQIGASSWSQVAAGNYQVLAIDNAGRLFTWGQNASGELGLGDTINRSSPVQVTSVSDAWRSIAIFGNKASGITTTGKLYSWGVGTNGEIGDGNTITRSNPIQIGASNNWTFVTAGASHKLAVNSGILYGWGYNVDGELGLGDTLSRSSPVQIGSYSSAAGTNQASIFLDSLGRLWGTGLGTNGENGLNSVTYSSPVLLNTGGSSFTTVSGGYQYAVALSTDGKIFAWGQNAAGQLGDNSTSIRTVPGVVNTSSWSFISAAKTTVVGNLNTFAISGTDNTLYGWGVNTNGQIGVNDLVSRSNPIQIWNANIFRSNPVQLTSGSWTKVSAGDVTSYGIKTNGTLYAWGTNTVGQLGQGDTTYRSSPTQIGTGSWTNVFAYGSSYVHAIRSDNKLYAWGLGTTGQLGINTNTSRSSPTQVDNGNYSYVASYPTTPNVLAVRTDGSLYAWGSKTNILLSEFSNASYTYSWAQVSVGPSHGIALRNDGRIFTWGNNGYGQLGLNDAVNRSSPVQIGAGTDNELWSSVAANSYRTYAVRNDGKLFGWGTDPIQYAVTSPVAIGNATSFVSVSAGVSHAVALDTTGSIYGWGDNAYTQVAPPTTNWSIAKDGMYIREGYLYGGIGVGNQYGNGDGTTLSRSVPVQIGPYQWSTMSNSLNMHTHAIRTDGSLWSWGSSSFGELGDGTLAILRSSMVQIGSSSWISVDARYGTTGNYAGSAAIRADYTLWTWGHNLYGQLGDGTTTNKNSPVQVAGGGSWSMVSKGPSHTVALSTTKLLYAWGLNTSGQLGINDYTSRSSPVQIGTSSWLMVTTGENYTLGIDINNRLFGWGINTVGQLTDLGYFTQIHSGSTSNSALLVRNDYAMYGIGSQFINGVNVLASSPIQITSGTVNTWRQGVVIGGGFAGFGAISYDYNLYTWGFSQTDGEFGVNNYNLTVNNPTIVTGGGSWNFIAAGARNMLGIKTNGTLWGWGLGTFGPNGDGTTISRSIPTQVGTDTDWDSVYIAQGTYNTHSLAIKTDGRLYAWGYNSRGQLGDGTVIHRSSPVQIPGSWSMVYGITDGLGSGIAATYGIKTDGTLWRWGASHFGGTDTNYTTNQSSPTQIGTDTDWNYVTGTAELGISYPVIYGYKTNGSLYYWAPNVTSNAPSTPFYVFARPFNYSLPITSPTLLASSTPYNALSTTILKNSNTGILAFSSNRKTLYGWGSNASGQLGQSDTIARSSPTQIAAAYTYYANVLSPTQIGSSSWSVITSGFSNVTGITTDGKLFTWGANNYGQLGQNDAVSRSSPVQVGTSSWTTASTKTYQTYAFTTDGTLYAWGYANVGDGTVSIYRSSPVQIGNKYDYVIYPRKFPTSTSFSQITAGGYHNLALDTTNRLYSWGRNDFGQLGINSYDTITKVIADGNNTIYTLSQNGALWGWGANSSGQLAQNDTQVVRSFPVQIASDKIWSKIAVSASRVVAIRNDGSLWAWGRNDNGQLGLGDVILRSSPVQIGTSSWSQVSTGYLHTAAIKIDGTVWTWGSNSVGQLGDGTTISRSSPVQVSTLTGSFIQVQAGSSTTAAIRSDYTAWIVGDNGSGGLGQNDIVTRSNPVQISGSWTYINSMGATHGIKTDGTLWAWGSNTTFGALGLNDVINRSSPVQVGTSSWSLVTGSSVGCPVFAIRSDYTLWAWGPQSAGSFGVNDIAITYRSSPVQVGTSFWSSIDMSGAGNNYTTYAISRDNVLFGWGNSSGGYELLYDGSTINRSSPVQLGGMPSRISTISQVGTSSWTSISAGTHHSVAIRSDYKLYAWGDNKYYQNGNVTPTTILSTANNQNNNAGSYIRGTDNMLFAWGYNGTGELGINTTTNRSNPVQIFANPYSTFSKVVRAKVATAGYSLAIDTTGQLFAWGSGAAGALGTTSTINRSSPTQVGTLTNWSDVAAGPSHALAIKSDGSLWGWGLNTSGQAGTLSWGKVSSGDRHTLAIRSDGQLFGWGKNDSGQVGDNSTVNRSSPVQLGTGSYSQISAGINISVAIRSDGTLYTWGYNNLGQLGLGDFVTRSSPTQVGTSSWSQVSAKDYIAAISNYRLFTWGNNNTYQLGDATTTYRLSPVQVGTSSWLQVSAGGNFASAIRIDGGLFVWGDNTQGQLGTGNTLIRSQPTQIGTSSWSQVSASNNFNTLAITADSKLYAWGNNQSSQLGINDNFNRSSPVQVGTSSWSLVSAGNNFSLGLKIDNTLWGWGDTSSGQFGAGTINLLSWTIINNGIGIHGDYTLWAWGDNSLGQLGVNSTITRSSPVQIGSVSWTVVSSNLSSTMAIKSDGSLWAWGSNTVGQLGFNDTVNRSSPVQLGSSSWTQVSVGISNTTLAITNNGSLFGWGLNSGYQLGLNDTINRSSPVQVGTSSYSQVSAGDSYGLAINTIGKLFAWGNNSVGQVGQTYLTANSKGLYGAGGFYLVGGIAYVWGANGNGQLGLGDTISRSSPVQLGTNSDYWKMIGLGRTIGIKIDGTLWTWGYNAEGELGVNDTIDRSSPVQVGSASNWTFAGDSRYTKWAINSAYELYAWGNNGGSSILADGVINRSNPVQIPGSWVMAKIGSTGSISSSLGIKVDGTLWSWGNNATGLLGQNDTISRSSPVQVTTLTNFIDVAIINTVNGNTAFALGADGKLFAWGNSPYGETGLGTTTARSSPTQIGTSSWTQIAGLGGPGFSTMAGLTIAGTLFGWGRNTNGMVGDGTIINRSAPTQIAGTWIGIAGSEYIGSSGYTGMAIKSDNTIWTWGINLYSGIGDNTTIDRSAPVQILSNINPVLVLSPIQIGTSSWTQISAGAGHNMALRTDGGLFVWGLNSVGQLGLAATTNRSSPTQVGTSSFTLVTAGTSISAAIRTDGGLFTWGLNLQGQLGSATTSNRSSPLQVGTSSWTKVSASNSFMMAIDTTSRLFTWGNNNTGQLGLGDTALRSSPVQVGTNYQTLYSNPVQLGATTGSGLTGYGLSFNTTPLLANQSSTVLNIGTSDFTIELWFYMNAAGSMDLVDYNWLYITTGYVQPVIYATVRSGKLSVYLQSIGTGNSQALRGPSISTNLWYHMAIVRISGSTSLYVNGTSYGSVTYSDSLTTTYGITFGANTGTTDGISIVTPTLPLKGYLTNIRFVVGNGVYTGNFTTPTTQLTSTQSSGTNINAITAGQTKLLTAQSATIIDNSGNSISLTQPWTYALPTVITVVPAGLFTVVNPTITAGESNGAVVSSSGSLYVWGNNAFGQVGDGTTVNKLAVSVVADATLYDNRSSPAQIGTSSWSQIAAGLNYSVAVDINGFLYAWGDNTNGYLGDNSITVTRSPKLIDAENSYTSISSGGSHTVALRTDGTLYAWGLNNAGQLGDNSSTNRSSPVQVNTGTVTSWAVVSAGSSFTVGLDSLNRIPYAWGDNSSGQLGDNTLVNKSAPVATTVTTVQNYSYQFNTGGSSNQKLTLPSSTAFDLSSGTWTIEFWMYALALPTAGNNNRILLFGTNATSNSYTVQFYNDGSLSANVPLGNNGFSTPAGVVTINAWYHVAVVSNASAVSIYVNGRLTAGPTIATQPTAGAVTLTIGYDTVSTVNYQFNGYLSNIRIVKGTAIYTSGFYPSSIVLTNITNTSLLTAQSATIVDNSTNAFTITNFGVTVATQNPFIYYSGSFNGTTQYLSIANSNNKLDFGTGDFTVEMWVYATSLNTGNSATSPFWYGDYGGSVPNFWISAYQGYLRLGYNAGTTPNTYTAGPIWNLNTWYHVAIVRSVNTVTLYVNGSSVATANFSAYNYTNVPGLIIGAGDYITSGWLASVNYYFPGYVSNFRAVKGVAVYTGNFTVPNNNLRTTQSAMTNIVALTGTETCLLTLQNSTIIDNSTNALAITNNKNVNVTSFNTPFAILAPGSSSWDTIQAGATNSLGVSNNTLYVWGAGTNGAMGDNSVVGKSVPTSIGTIYSITEKLYSSPVQIASTSNKSWTTVAAGTGHTLAIASDYSLWGWGNNSNGELGISTTLARSSPAQIGTSSWSFVNASVNTTHLIRATDRLMFGTGINNNFNLGDNSSVNRSAPVQLFTSTTTSPLIPMKLTSVSTSSFTQVQVGSAASIIGSNGSLWTWGTNTDGQIGDWTNVSRSSPTQLGGLTVTYVPSPVQVGSSSYSLVSAGFSHTLAIDSNSLLYAWGKTPANGDSVTRSSPIQIGSNSWLFISAGNDVSQAIDTTKTLYAWGLNTNYQLGSATLYVNKSITSPIAIGTVAIINSSHTNATGSGQGGYIKNI